MRTAATLLLLLPITFSNLSAQEYTVVNAFPKLLLVEPVGLANAGDGSNRLYAVEQPGVIKVFENDPDVSSYNIFLDLRDRVISGGEQGLLGLVFDPDYEHNGYFYVNYTTPNPLRTIVSRFRVRPDDPLAADPASELVILTIRQPDAVHNGGQLAFGPDGYLYIASGDGGFAGDPANNAQNKNTLLGKILRIDVNGINVEQPYFIPIDNPDFGATEYRGEIYAYGLRNPWRFSFDAATGQLWCADVGQDTWEEINIISRGGNYGWSIMEGLHCFGVTAQCDTTGLIPPLWEYRHGDDGYAVTGGYVYRGPTLTSLYGRYIYGDFASGKIWSIEYDGAAPPVNTLLAKTDIAVSSFGVDEDDELYICSLHGAIYRLVQPAGAAGDAGDGRFTLESSQPNPVTSTARIAYTLDRAAHVSLTLHDMMGRPVMSVVDADQSSGEHRVKLDAASLPAGSYYYRLTSGGKVATRRMVVAR